MRVGRDESVTFDAVFSFCDDVTEAVTFIQYHFPLEMMGGMHFGVHTEFEGVA
jgi:hypothetical protein